MERWALAFVLVAGLGGCSTTNETVDDGGTSPSDLTCTAASDCVSTAYTRPVRSADDCYCLGCPGTAMNAAAANRNRDQWMQRCQERTANCAAPACAYPPPTGCVANACRVGSSTTPATCPAGGGTCGPEGTLCGSICCGSREWCDETIQACRCGIQAGCAGDQICAVAGFEASDVCGYTCCGGSSGRACPL
jgi:hypothetical protein